jgi:hypothetical protein
LDVGQSKTGPDSWLALACKMAVWPYLMRWLPWLHPYIGAKEWLDVKLDAARSLVLDENAVAIKWR